MRPAYWWKVISTGVSIWPPRSIAQDDGGRSNLGGGWVRSPRREPPASCNIRLVTLAAAVAAASSTVTPATTAVTPATAMAAAAAMLTAAAASAEMRHAAGRSAAADMHAAMPAAASEMPTAMAAGLGKSPRVPAAAKNLRSTGMPSGDLRTGGSGCLGAMRELQAG